MRTRRSAGAAAGGSSGEPDAPSTLNATLLPLFSAQKLKELLVARQLPTNGGHDKLLLRLQDALEAEKSSPPKHAATASTDTASPVSSVTTASSTTAISEKAAARTPRRKIGRSSTATSAPIEKTDEVAVPPSASADELSDLTSTAVVSSVEAVPETVEQSSPQSATSIVSPKVMGNLPVSEQNSGTEESVPMEVDDTSTQKNALTAPEDIRNKYRRMRQLESSLAHVSSDAVPSVAASVLPIRDVVKNVDDVNAVKEIVKKSPRKKRRSKSPFQSTSPATHQKSPLVTTSVAEADVVAVINSSVSTTPVAPSSATGEGVAKQTISATTKQPRSKETAEKIHIKQKSEVASNRSEKRSKVGSVSKSAVEKSLAELKRKRDENRKKENSRSADTTPKTTTKPLPTQLSSRSDSVVKTKIKTVKSTQSAKAAGQQQIDQVGKGTTIITTTTKEKSSQSVASVSYGGGQKAISSVKEKSLSSESQSVPKPSATISFKKPASLLSPKKAVVSTSVASLSQASTSKETSRSLMALPPVAPQPQPVSTVTTVDHILGMMDICPKPAKLAETKWDLRAGAGSKKVVVVKDEVLTEDREKAKRKGKKPTLTRQRPSTASSSRVVDPLPPPPPPPGPPPSRRPPVVQDASENVVTIPLPSSPEPPSLVDISADSPLLPPPPPPLPPPPHLPAVIDEQLPPPPPPPPSTSDHEESTAEFSEVSSTSEIPSAEIPAPPVTSPDSGKRLSGGGEHVDDEHWDLLEDSYNRQPEIISSTIDAEQSLTEIDTEDAGTAAVVENENEMEDGGRSSDEVSSDDDSPFSDEESDSGESEIDADQQNISIEDIDTGEEYDEEGYGDDELQLIGYKDAEPLPDFLPSQLPEEPAKSVPMYAQIANENEDDVEAGSTFRREFEDEMVRKLSIPVKERKDKSGDGAVAEAEEGDEDVAAVVAAGQEDDDAAVPTKKRQQRKRRNSEDEEPPELDASLVQLDFNNANVHMKAVVDEPNQAEPDTSVGFAIMYASIRASYGVYEGKVAYQIKIVEKLSPNHLPFEDVYANDLRVGWSEQNTGIVLGDSPMSYAYAAVGKKATDSRFHAWGDTFDTGDIITCCIDFDGRKVAYYKNDKLIGVAFEKIPNRTRIKVEDEEEETTAGTNTVSDTSIAVYFPHIASKNCRFQVNFGHEGAWLPLPEGYRFISEISDDKRVAGPAVPESKGDCTVLMMVGLPGVGKSTWVRHYFKSHIDERWTIISAESIMDMMKVDGIPRQRIHSGRWDVVMGLIAKTINKTIQLAGRRKQNYIIDQTNVSANARKRKLQAFKDFRRVCVVLVPVNDVFLSRCQKQTNETRTEMPVEAMLELKAVYSIPTLEAEGQYMEDVHFVEPENVGDDGDASGELSAAFELVAKYNEEGKPWYQKKYEQQARDAKPTSVISDHRSSTNTDKQTTDNREGAETALSVEVPTTSGDGKATPSVTPGSVAEGTTPGWVAPQVTWRWNGTHWVMNINQGYCGFGDALPPSLQPPPPTPTSTGDAVTTADKWAAMKRAAAGHLSSTAIQPDDEPVAEPTTTSEDTVTISEVNEAHE